MNDYRIQNQAAVVTKDRYETHRPMMLSRWEATAVVLCIPSLLFTGVTGFVVHPAASTGARDFASLAAKRKNRKDSVDDWYDSVDDGATADDVFWKEMERQRLENQITPTNMDVFAAMEPPSQTPAGIPNTTGAQVVSNVNGGGLSPGISPSGFPATPPSRRPATMEQQKTAEATLSEYARFQVEDNWLDDELQEMFSSTEEVELDEVLSLAEETERLEAQLEALPDGYGSGVSFGDTGSEPWDTWGKDADTMNRDVERANVRQVDPPSPDSEFYFDINELDGDIHVYEEAFKRKMKDCQMSSLRLRKAETSSKAAEFFGRAPNAREGYDRIWVSAVDNACVKSLIGNLRNYGVEFADNFGDFEDGSPLDATKYTIEDLASFKARAVYAVTGLPCIASRSSFEIEPIPPAASTGINNPKVLSGYRINDIGDDVDYICEALKPLSEPTRVTRFTSCVCYYDGDMEMFEHGVCDVDLHFSKSERTFIPMAQAVTNIIETLKLTHGLEYQKFLRSRVEDAAGGSLGSASMKLRDRVLKDGKVLPNDIIDVSRFMDSQVDVNLMDDCAKELANRFMKQKPTKIMTVATTGLVIALPMAKYLQVPVVYARKERNVVMADTYQAGFSSKTVGKNRELVVSKSHIDIDDRILVVDDFLSSGASQEALLRIISEAEAVAVGVGVLLEKSYESGRQSLSGFNLPIHSLCRVASVKNGSIQLLEEDGYDKK